ncbi:hypothetical protein [Arcobacter roscoffensis]|uniref:PDP protein n=1 Tax=Arcobacter roscoffensis TaxID=2961520 RepID=A0ABY5E6C1_9BACT|nr:hypothetical protein [Arcobacter roscoffensis]UTJ06263.1 hypothetical protein NJU99_13560 [Arcobacter roscoffensis]
MIRILMFVVLSFCFTYAQQSNDSSSLTKQKLEIKELKKELNLFYNQKEKEYQERKKELETILAKIESEKKEIEQLYSKNEQTLRDINQTVESKTTKIFNKMKPKVASKIFDEMIAEGKLEDVFDIIIRLKEKNITLLFKSLSVQNAAQLTEMLENFNIKDEKGE